MSCNISAYNLALEQSMSISLILTCIATHARIYIMRLPCQEPVVVPAAKRLKRKPKTTQRQSSHNRGNKLTASRRNKNTLHYVPQKTRATISRDISFCRQANSASLFTTACRFFCIKYNIAFNPVKCLDPTYTDTAFI